MTAQTLKRIKFGVIFFYLSLFAVLALYDEKPDPELAQLMAQPQPEVMEPGNGWIAFLGFGAPEAVSPYVHGKEKIQKLRDAVSTGKNYSEFYKSVADSKSDLAFQGKLPSFYGKKEGGVLAYAAGHPDEIKALVSNNRELLQRYESLRTYPRYIEPLDYGYDTPIPRFSPLRNTQTARLLQLAARAKQGDVAGALAGLRDDAEFWRFIARNSKTLISKLISFSALSNDMRFAAELETYRPLKKQEIETIRNILRPFGNGEISLVAPFRGEVRYMQKGMDLSTWQNMKKWSPERLVFKQNATGNLMYANYRDIIRIAELTPQQYAVEVRQRESKKTSAPRIGIRFLYNSVGEILGMIAIPSLSAYIEKGHNLEGLRRLSMLKVLSRMGNVPPERMQRFLDSHSAEFGNPYTGAAMAWDSRKGSIFFNGLSGDKVVEVFM